MTKTILSTENREFLDGLKEQYNKTLATGSITLMKVNEETGEIRLSPSNRKYPKQEAIDRFTAEKKLFILNNPSIRVINESDYYYVYAYVKPNNTKHIFTSYITFQGKKD